jgi:hypothetical protein
MDLQDVPGQGVKGYFLILPTLWIAYVDKVTFEINVLPLQLEQFPSSHAGKVSHLHQVSRLNIGVLLDCFQECG